MFSCPTQQTIDVTEELRAPVYRFVSEKAVAFDKVCYTIFYSASKSTAHLTLVYERLVVSIQAETDGMSTFHVYITT